MKKWKLGDEKEWFTKWAQKGWVTQCISVLRLPLTKYHKLGIRDVCLALLEAEGLRYRHWQDHVSSEAARRGLFHVSCLAPGSSLRCGNVTPIFTWHSPMCLSSCASTLSLLRLDYTSPMGLGPAYWAPFNLIILVKTLSPNKTNFWATEG